MQNCIGKNEGWLYMPQMTEAGKERLLALRKKQADREWAKAKQGEGGEHYARAKHLYASLENIRNHKTK